MKTLIPILLISLVALSSCAVTSHPVSGSAPGKPIASADMERLIDTPGPVALQSIVSADWLVPLSGLLNLKHPKAKHAGLQDRDEPIQVYAHLLKHPTRGYYLVDTGVSSRVRTDPDEVGLGWMLQKVMRTEKLIIHQATADIVKGVPAKLSGVLFTHLHIDHISGAPDIPADVPLYVAAPEATARNFLNLFVQGASDKLLKGKRPLSEWRFQPDAQPWKPSVIDLFEDGSVFVISTPGHTPGSVAYLVRTPQGPVLLTGDTCHTRWGWDNSVEPGRFTEDLQQNRASLQQLKDLVAQHPGIQVRLGHQP